MDRLVVWLDDHLTTGEIDEPVYIQAAAFGVQPRLAIALGVMPYPEFVRMVHDARRVITHGGPGSILSVLASGKVPIVVPRDPIHGEHVDGHQIEFCRWLAERRSIRVVENVAGLSQVLGDEGPSDQDLAVGPAPEVLERLRSIIERGAAT